MFHIFEGHRKSYRTALKCPWLADAWQGSNVRDEKEVKKPKKGGWSLPFVAPRPQNPRPAPDQSKQLQTPAGGHKEASEGISNGGKSLRQETVVSELELQ